MVKSWNVCACLLQRKPGEAHGKLEEEDQSLGDKQVGWSQMSR